MLIATLNHNLPSLTDNLVDQLKRDPLFPECELMVVDNGSKEALASSTTHRLDSNIFFGGGFNVGAAARICSHYAKAFVFLCCVCSIQCLGKSDAVRGIQTDDANPAGGCLRT